MDALVEPNARNLRCLTAFDSERPDRSDVELALRTIILWAGDDPDRPGLNETPARVARAFKEWFRGYGEDPEAILRKTFEEIEG